MKKSAIFTLMFVLVATLLFGCAGDGRRTSATPLPGSVRRNGTTTLLFCPRWMATTSPAHTAWSTSSVGWRRRSSRRTSRSPLPKNTFGATKPSNGAIKRRNWCTLPLRTEQTFISGSWKTICSMRSGKTAWEMSIACICALSNTTDCFFRFGGYDVSKVRR